jgi:hypothetical protein
VLAIQAPSLCLLYTAVNLRLLLWALEIKQCKERTRLEEKYLFQSTWIWLSDAWSNLSTSFASPAHLLRKEVIQPHLPIRLPCYDFTPITNPTFGGALLAVKLPTSGVVSSHGVTGGVYKARERIHGSMLTCHY